MKTYRLFTAAVLCILSLQGAAAQDRKEPDRNMAENANFSKDRLDFSAAYIDGTPVGSDMLKGVNVFCVFGGSNCSPCVTLGNIMTRLVEEEKYDRGDVKFLFITDDDEKVRIREIKR